VETGRVINRRYLLQRLIKQGQVCAIYQGMDQVLQRVVAVKAVPAPHIPAYRAALKMTADFSHPNVVGTYDLVMEPEMLYIVQEYIEGVDFPRCCTYNYHPTRSLISACKSARPWCMPVMPHTVYATGT